MSKKYNNAFSKKQISPKLLFKESGFIKLKKASTGFNPPGALSSSNIIIGFK